MPYYRSRFRKYYKRRRYGYGNYRKSSNLAYQAYKMAKSVKREVAGEYKFFQDAITTAAVQDVSGTVYHLTNIAQGSGDDDRTGKQIKLTSLEIQLTLFVGASGTDISRILIVRANQSTAPTLQTILDVNGDPTYSLRNLEYTTLFTVLYNKTFALDAARQGEIHTKIYKRMSSKCLFEYNSTTPVEGHLYMIICSNQGVASGNEPKHIFNARVRYLDN